MLFGVVIGTYSSIFIAAPLLILFRLRPSTADRREGRRTEEAAPVQKRGRRPTWPKASSSGAAHFPGRAPIDAYGNGGFRFADMSHRGSILCLPSGIYGWEPADPAMLARPTISPACWPRRPTSRSCSSAAAAT